MELDELIQLCSQKHRKAQSELFIRYKDMLFTLCLKYCKNRPEAEDHLQDAFIKIFQNIDRYRHKGSFEGWMKRIVINSAIDRYKKDMYMHPIDEERTQIEDTTVAQSELDIPLKTLLSFIQELPSRYRMIFNLYQMDGYSHKEIADMLSISVGTSKSNLHRAKQILKEKIFSLNEADRNKRNLKHG